MYIRNAMKPTVDHRSERRIVTNKFDYKSKQE